MEKLKEIISEYSGVPAEIISDDMSLNADLGIDSFGLISMICSIEDTYNVKIPDQELSNFQTLDDVYTFISENQPKLA